MEILPHFFTLRPRGLNRPSLGRTLTWRCILTPHIIHRRPPGCGPRLRKQHVYTKETSDLRLKG